MYEKETIEQEERDRERMERERREEEERGEKRARTDTDTDAESTRSRQKKGQMKSIFLSDSDKEAIVEFIKQHEELYDKTNDSFKDKQKKERLWEQLAATRNLPIQTVKKGFETQCTRSSAFKSPKRPSAATASASVPDSSRDTESEMEINITSDVTHQPLSTSPKRRQPPVAIATTSADTVLDQFQQMRSMICNPRPSLPKPNLK